MMTYRTSGLAWALVALSIPALASAQEADTEALAQRCHAGEWVLCATAGARYQLGRGVTRNYSTAGELYTRACDHNVVSGCGLLGALFADGLGVTRDPANAVLLFRRACDGAFENSCGQLGFMMVAGRGTVRDIPGAAPYLERGCNASHHVACEVLGRMTIRGVGVPRDLVRGQTLLQRACAGGQQSACSADTGTSEFVAPPPVTGAPNYAAPPPVTGLQTFAAPPPVVAPRPVVAPPPVVDRTPPRAAYVYRPRSYRPRTPESSASSSSSSSSSSVSLLGGEHRASVFSIGYEAAPYHTDTAARTGFFGLGFRHSRGPIEFSFDGRYGGGTLAPALAPHAEWKAAVLGVGLGANLLSWPRADRESFSIINLSGGLNASLALGDTNGGDAFRLGGYVANTIYLLCWVGVRTEFTGSLVGEGTWGHTLYGTVFFGGRSSQQCR